MGGKRKSKPGGGGLDFLSKNTLPKNGENKAKKSGRILENFMKLEFDFKNLWSAVAGLAPQIKSGGMENEYSTVWLTLKRVARTAFSADIKK